MRRSQSADWGWLMTEMPDVKDEEGAVEAVETQLASLQEAFREWRVRFCQGHSNPGDAEARYTAWQTVESEYLALDQILSFLASLLEDADDLAAANAALDEPGESIPWEVGKAEMRLDR